MKEINTIAEIGINHNGDIDLCKKIIDQAVIAGFDYVKFQKRNPEKAVPESQKGKIRETPWGKMTYIEYKHKIEFSEEQYDEIDMYCKSKGIRWFASVWDEDSIDFMKKYTTITKIPSALITNETLLRSARAEFDQLIISTGMSTEEQVEKAVDISNPDVIMHTNSTYPSPVKELKLEYIKWLKDKYPNKQIGYSGHEYGITASISSIALGAEWIERHVTVDRTLWGSDQLASVEPIGMIKLIKGIKELNSALGGYEPRKIFNSEMEKLNSLRK